MSPIQELLGELHFKADLFDAATQKEIDAFTKQSSDFTPAQCVRIRTLHHGLQGLEKTTVAKAKKKIAKKGKQAASAAAGTNGSANWEHQFDVEFGGVSGQKKGAKIGVQIHSDSIDIEQARRLFRSSALSIEIRANAKDADGQTTIEGEETKAPKLVTVAVAKGWSDGVDHISTSLTIPGVDVDLGVLGQFRYRKGTLKLTRTGDAKPDEQDVDGQKTIEDDEPGDQDVAA